MKSRKFFQNISFFLTQNKSNIIILLVIVFSIISIIIQNVNSKEAISVNDEELEKNKYEGKIAVYITGEVKNPGVYYVDEGSRLEALIEICGGLNEDADVSELNLAEKLNDADKIDVPKIIVNAQEDEEENNDSGLININTASKEELKTLNGIGDTLADNIINYRKNSKFETIEDLLNVNGIGQSKYNAIKEYICVN